MISEPTLEMEEDNRFEFGKNLATIIEYLNENHIWGTEQSFKETLEMQNLKRNKLLVVGSGSGIFPLAARGLGSSVRSFEFDPHSIRISPSIRYLMVSARLIEHK